MKVARSLMILAAFSMVAAAVPQPATPEQRGGLPVNNDLATLHFQTNLGSGRAIRGSGRIQINVKGTVVLRHFKGTEQITGTLRKEFEDKDYKTYHGQGTITLQGEWTTVYFFGTQISGVWYGRGLMRVTGEFDQNLNTGTYWYDDVNQKYYYPSSTTMLVELPQKAMQTRTKLRARPMSEF